MRLPALAIASLAALILLAGCSAPAGDSTSQPGDGPTEGAVVSGECNPVSGGPAAEAVTVEDDGTGAPAAVFEAPLSVETTERSVVAEGDGEQVLPGDVVLIDVSLFNGATGAAGASTGHIGAGVISVTLDESQTVDGFVRTIVCAHVGDRLVGVVPPSQAYGEAGNSELGIGPNEPVVLLVDVVALDGPPEAEEWTDAPEVDFSGTVPSVALEGAPRPELLVSVLEEGDGAVVRYGHQVTVNYAGTSWDTGEVFDESYSKSPATFSTAGVVAGFAAAIVGNRVGSTVLVSMPPEYGYGPATGAETDHALAGQTLVFVLEIIAVAE